MAADIEDDRRVVLILPLEVPTGMAELVVTGESQQGRKLRRSVRVFPILTSSAAAAAAEPRPQRKLWVAKVTPASRAAVAAKESWHGKHSSSRLRVMVV